MISTISKKMNPGCDYTRSRLFIDLETYSSVDIAKAGSFKYMESPDFDILLFAFAFDHRPVNVIDLTDRGLSDHFVEMLTDPGIVKVAHNSAFERAALESYTGEYMPPEQWEDTMIMSAYNGLPLSLDSAGAVLELKDQKIKEGTSLISYFCKPCKPTIANGGRTRNLPKHAPDKWLRFVEYCRRDVEVEQAIYYRLCDLKQPSWEKLVFNLDARINERGVMIDRELVESAVSVDMVAKETMLTEMKKLTGVENPGSPAQLVQWINNNGVRCESLDKKALADLLDQDLPPIVRRVIQLRQQTGKTSTKKYETMLTAASEEDDRIRGVLQYYGATRTGRWGGRLVQVQNLPQNHLEDIAEVRELVRERDLDTLQMCYDSVPDVLSQLIRTALVAKPGHTFLVADYSAIEARVIAYLAGEQWRMDVFKNGGDIYCSSASQMFRVPVEKHGVNSHLRPKGKIAELACGYGGGPAALKAFGADKMGLSDEEMQTIVRQWRKASPSITRLWGTVQDAALYALANPGQRVPVLMKKGALPVATYYRDCDALRCELPSGRILSYWHAKEQDGELVFYGQNQTTRNMEWIKSWGGRLVENIVQAFARDCLAVAMLRLDRLGYRICFSVHDEIIAEEPRGGRTWEDMAEVMGRPIDWAPGLLLRADGYSTDFYMKD